jgi:hypothetical protein
MFKEPRKEESEEGELGDPDMMHMMAMMGFSDLRSIGIDSARLCSLAGRYVKKGCVTGPPGWESIPASYKVL